MIAYRNSVFRYEKVDDSFNFTRLKKLLVFGFLAVFMFSGCGLIYRGVLGVDTTPQWFEKKDIDKKIKKWNLENEIHLVLDTASYTNVIKRHTKRAIDSLSVDTSIATKRLRYKAGAVGKDDLQPVQVRLFTQDSEEIFKLVNCYVDPPIPMDWNVENAFDSFPLYTPDIVRNTYNYDLEFLLSHSKTLKGESIGVADLKSSDYYLIVIWNSFFIRPSKKLIETVKEYIVAHPEVAITPIYINNHNAQIWNQIEDEQRQLIYKHYKEQDGTN